MAASVSRRRALTLLAGSTLGVSLLGAGATSIFAQANLIRYVDTDRLNLRSGPGLTHGVIETLETGAAVELVPTERLHADSVNWIGVNVQASGNFGYVDSQYLTLNLTSLNEEAEESAGTGGETDAGPVASAESIATKWVVVPDANLRAGAGFSFAVLKELATGTQVQVTGPADWVDDLSWLPVTVATMSGWMAEIVLSDEAPPQADTDEHLAMWVSIEDANLRDAAGFSGTVLKEIPLGTEVAITGAASSVDGYDWLPVTIGEDSGWMATIVLSETRPATPGFETSAKFTVFDGPLNLRNEPGINTGIIGTYPTGSTGTIVSDTASSVDDLLWHEVVLDEDGATGWFAEMFISTEDVPASGTMTVVDGPLNFRMNPTLEGSIVGRLPTGSVVDVLETTTSSADGFDWLHVSYNGQTGWIATEFLAAGETE